MSKARSGAGFWDFLGAVSTCRNPGSRRESPVWRPASLNFSLAVWPDISLTLGLWLFLSHFYILPALTRGIKWVLTLMTVRVNMEPEVSL